MGRGYLQALARFEPESELEISAVAPRGFRHDPTWPLPEGVHELSAAQARAAPPPELGLGFIHPPLLERLIGRRKVNLFVWESDRVPPAWVEPLKRGADWTAVPSTFVREALVASGFPAEKAIVAPYGWDEAADRDPPPPAGTRPFTFLAVMSPHWRKGVRELFDAYGRAFRREDDVRLVVKSTYDPGAERRRRSFEIPSWREAMAGAGLLTPAAPAVAIDLRTLPDVGMASVYRAADVHVSPTWGEAFGLTVLESLAAGVPAIATGWGGHTSYLPAGPDLLPYRLEAARGALYAEAPGARVAVPDVEALAERMRWHAEHPPASRALGASARAAVAGLTWAEAARRLLLTSAGDRTS